jgi:uncharacterized protein (DUF433 family)
MLRKVNRRPPLPTPPVPRPCRVPQSSSYTGGVNSLSRITADPEIMGGRPCIRGMRVTVGTVVGLVAAGHSREEILLLYPYLEVEDITEALAYAAWRSDEFEVPISSS